MDRREFLKGTGWMGLAAVTAGFQVNKVGSAVGAPMAEFAVPPLKRVRIGFVGVGARGTYAVKRICQMPGVEITALCDIKAEAIKGCQDHLKSKKLPPAKEYLGPEAYKALCRECECDVDRRRAHQGHSRRQDQGRQRGPALRRSHPPHPRRQIHFLPFLCQVKP